MQKQICEDLISSWLFLSSSVRSDRLVQNMTFREICVCHLLYESASKSKEDEESGVTATDVCNFTGMLKSQTNKVINDMEKNGLLIRIRSQKDRRNIYLKLSEKGTQVYLEEHNRIVARLGKVTEDLGEKKMKEISEAMNTVGEAIMKNHRIIKD